MFELAEVESEAGPLHAYVSIDPGDGKRHPLILWVVGGFSNSIGEIAWDTGSRENDQTANVFRKAGILMMYPSFRGGNDNPGSKEAFLGEVDDLLSAAAHAKNLDYVDPNRIYLGGHSTGGTLALLAAAANDSFRAVFALGPIDNPRSYGTEYLPYDTSDRMESALRSPIVWLNQIDVPTLVFEGEDGNLGALLAMKRAGEGNPNLSFFPVENANHFNIISPVSELLAESILNDTDKTWSHRINVAAVKERIGTILPPPRPPFPAGDPKSDTVSFEYAVFLKDRKNKEAVLAELKELMATEFPELSWSAGEPSGSQDISVLVLEDAAESYPPPSLEMLEYSGRGLNENQSLDLQESQTVVRLLFRHPAEKSLEGLKSANRLVGRTAEMWDGFPWDDSTREVFAPESWEELRISGWNGEFPEVWTHTSVHIYRNEDHVRAIMLGMEKFGLPDVVCERFYHTQREAVNILMNALAQRLIEGEILEDPTRFPLDLREIETDEYRDVLMDGIRGEGSGKAILALHSGGWDLGDPINRIIEVYPTNYPGEDFFIMQNAMLRDMFGFEDEVINVDSANQEIEAASDKAKEELPRLRQEFQDGYAPGEYILVKTPFETDSGGTEWMWVEVRAWGDDGAITGMLQSEPHNVSGLQSGTEVVVKETEVFDYLRRYADGTEEGNETGKIIERLYQSQP